MIKIIKNKIHIAEMHNIVDGALDLVNPNQKVIDVPQTRKTGHIVLHTE